MSDYTPTTEQVRDQYATAWWDDFSLTELDDPVGQECTERDAAEFDRWHAEEIRRAKEAAWDEGHSWGWADAQEAHDVRQDRDRADWNMNIINPYRGEEEA